MDQLREVFDFNSGFIAALLMGGLIVRFCRALASLSGPGWMVFVAATLLPSLVTIGTTFFVHSLKGTPEPIASTIPVAVMSLPSFSGLAYHTRRKTAGLADASADLDGAESPLQGAESR
jgi:hypothetical protein